METSIPTDTYKFKVAQKVIFLNNELVILGEKNSSLDHNGLRDSFANYQPKGLVLFVDSQMINRASKRRVAKRLGDSLRSLRRQKGWTQSQAGEAVGVDSATIRKW